MKLKISYNEQCKELIEDLQTIESLELISHNEDIFKERKNAFKFKSSFSARQTPFAVIYDDENNPISAFYSEAGDCTYDRIIHVIDKLSNS